MNVVPYKPNYGCINYECASQGNVDTYQCTDCGDFQFCDRHLKEHERLACETCGREVCSLSINMCLGIKCCDVCQEGFRLGSEK